MRKGQKHTEISKQLNREKHLGKEVSKATRDKIRDFRLGRKFGPMSEKGRENLSIAHKGLQVGEKNPFFGYHHTKEVKEKLSKLIKGVSHGPMSETTKEKIRESVILQHQNETKEERDAINKKIGDGNRGKTLSENTKNLISEGNKGKKRTPKQREKYKLCCKSGKEHPFFGRKYSIKERERLCESSKQGWINMEEDVKNKRSENLRISTIKRIEKQKFNGLPMMPCVGKYETLILDNLEHCIGYPILRQHRVAGYFLDGYCPMLNLAIEVDEKYHKKVTEMKRMKIRENNIKDELGCSFLRVEV